MGKRKAVIQRLEREYDRREENGVAFYKSGVVEEWLEYLRMAKERERLEKIRIERERVEKLEMEKIARENAVREEERKKKEKKENEIREKKRKEKEKQEKEVRDRAAVVSVEKRRQEERRAASKMSSPGESKTSFAVVGCPEGALRVKPGLNSLKNALKKAKENGISEIFLENGVHDEKGGTVVIDFPITIVGESQEGCTIIGGLHMKGKEEDDVNVEHLTISQS